MDAATKPRDISSRWHQAEALLAAAWCLPSAALAGYVSIVVGAWAPDTSKAMLLGSPALILLGRVLIWGWGFGSLRGRGSLARRVALGLLIDVGLQGLAGVANFRSPTFLMAEIFSAGVCLIPAQLFVRWTREGTHLLARNIMHLLFHSALLLAIWPMLLMHCFGGDWQAWAARTSTANKVYLQLLFIPCVLLIAAMQEFHAQGCGTPMPGDAPRRLVTTGVYAYVANPMQIGKFGVLFGWGLFWRNPWVVAAAFCGALYSVTLAKWKEGRDLAARFGDEWMEYRKNVRRWWPRWRPWLTAKDAAMLYLDLDCGPCGVVARWFAARWPAALRILPLAAHTSGTLNRMTYSQSGSNREYSGIAALARACNHLSFGWAFCGWMLQIPGIAWSAELICSAVAPARPKSCATPASHPPAWC